MAQRGWITKEQRKKAGSVWVYHCYVSKPETGKKVEHTHLIGAVSDYPSEKDVWREIDRRHLKPRPDRKAIASGRLTFGDLAASYRENGMKKLAETTQYTYAHYIDDYLCPRWGKSLALDIEPLEIEQWLAALDGLSNPSRDKLRRIMSRVYTQAQKYGLIPRSEASNPVRWVEQSAKSSYKPIVVDPATAAKIFQNLSGMEQALVILVAATGVRISEAMGLQWQDVDYENKQINLCRVWVQDKVVERLKTDDSEAPVPLTDLLADCLRSWHQETMYARPTDWIFASTRSRGLKPRSSSVLTADHLRPAAIAAGVKLKKGQRFGFHNLRHGLGSWLVNQGTDVKTVQGLLRHANITTTLGIYAHRVNALMMAAQDSVMRAMQSETETVQ
jgi:integrase